MNGQLITKDILISNLKQTISDAQIEKNRLIQEKSAIQNKSEKFTS